MSPSPLRLYRERISAVGTARHAPAPRRVAGRAHPLRRLRPLQAHARHGTDARHARTHARGTYGTHARRRSSPACVSRHPPSLAAQARPRTLRRRAPPRGRQLVALTHFLRTHTSPLVHVRSVCGQVAGRACRPQVGRAQAAPPHVARGDAARAGAWRRLGGRLVRVLPLRGVHMDVELPVAAAPALRLPLPTPPSESARLCRLLPALVVEAMGEAAPSDGLLHASGDFALFHSALFFDAVVAHLRCATRAPLRPPPATRRDREFPAPSRLLALVERRTLGLPPRDVGSTASPPSASPRSSAARAALRPGSAASAGRAPSPPSSCLRAGGRPQPPGRLSTQRRACSGRARTTRRPSTTRATPSRPTCWTSTSSAAGRRPSPPRGRSCQGARRPARAPPRGRPPGLDRNERVCPICPLFRSARLGCCPRSPHAVGVHRTCLAPCYVEQPVMRM